MKKKILLINVLIVLSLVMVSCEKLSTIENKDTIGIDVKEDVVSVRDELNIPLLKLNSLDPLENKNFDYHSFNKLVYQSLFEFDNELKIVPLLVEEYKVLEDGKNIEIKLKDDIYWHNNEKLTTEDVAFTIGKLNEIEENSIYKDVFKSALGSFSNLNIGRTIHASIIDDRKINISFDKVYGNNLETLTFPLVNSSSYLEDDFKPIGTGPYVFINYNSSQGIKLEKNPNYWNGEVNISKVNGKVFENQDLILKAFEDGRVDIANISHGYLEKYKKQANVNVLEYISPEYEFLSYNFKNKLFSGENGKKIRKAIYYGIDRQRIIGEIYKGHATQTDTPILPNSYLTDDTKNFYGFNKDKAVSILEEAGFSSLGRDGILKDHFGKRLSFNLITNFSNLYRRKTAEFIKEDLKEIGIDIVLDYPLKDVENMDSGKIDKEWEKLNRTISSGNYDLAILGWSTSKVPDLSFMFHSSFISEGTNINFYNDEAMDSLIYGMYFSKREGKENISVELQEHIMEELPYGSLFFENGALILSKNIRGPFRPNFYNLYKGIDKCEIVEIQN